MSLDGVKHLGEGEVPRCDVTLTLFPEAQLLVEGHQGVLAHEQGDAHADSGDTASSATSGWSHCPAGGMCGARPAGGRGNRLTDFILNFLHDEVRNSLAFKEVCPQNRV